MELRQEDQIGLQRSITFKNDPTTLGSLQFEALCSALPAATLSTTTHI